ncbi:MAG: hypothetical protein US42_C0001G0021 [Candidatus Magasanikbacteria bacterium GW2011_GWC2_37_14]|uniref:Uncharacterized protein n=1 Tax=Candidatus Magasanikbacteria bacterium GW2011_GWC2_37_14 TaxID=1619046 RepID=A0A0G0GPT6_9BACT|nr:MAG: hypothetical protein US42_C0001G0021 [Candidatus Magasanikbacteria bacterium GW2011_GWC2_37_14]
MQNIIIVNKKINLAEIKKLASETFGDMVKGVADIERKIIALGGEMHADAEEILLANGSVQANLWGFNIYPEQSPENFIEFHSLINIRPAQNNRSMNIESKEIQNSIKEIIQSLIV